VVHLETRCGNCSFRDASSSSIRLAVRWTLPNSLVTSTKAEPALALRYHSYSRRQLTARTCDLPKAVRPGHWPPAGVCNRRTVGTVRCWPRYLVEAARAEFILVYLQRGEKLKGGFLEIGAALAGGAHVIVVDHLDQIEALVSARRHPKVHQFRFIGKALGRIQKQGFGPPYPNLYQNTNPHVEDIVLSCG
jgi:hypothetical protein